MRGFLINKNLCFYYWLKRRIGKDRAFKVVNKIEKIILIFGREVIRSTNNEVKPSTLQPGGQGLLKDDPELRFFMPPSKVGQGAAEWVKDIRTVNLEINNDLSLIRREE